MMKVFMGNTTLLFSESQTCHAPRSHDAETLRGKGLTRFLQSLNPDGEKITIYIRTDDAQKTLQQWKNSLLFVPAAGGLVQNEAGEILFIFRHNKWDLPKGKPEGKESTEETALREVNEECGVTGLEIKNPLPSTWHLYPLSNGQYAIKQSYWYHMITRRRDTLQPQENEGITQVQWIAMPVPDYILDNAFLSIRELVLYFQRKNL